jgi:hypothetical protein
MVILSLQNTPQGDFPKQSMNHEEISENNVAQFFVSPRLSLLER